MGGGYGPVFLIHIFFSLLFFLLFILGGREFPFGDHRGRTAIRKRYCLVVSSTARKGQKGIVSRLVRCYHHYPSLTLTIPGYLVVTLCFMTLDGPISCITRPVLYYI